MIISRKAINKLVDDIELDKSFILAKGKSDGKDGIWAVSTKDQAHIELIRLDGHRRVKLE